MYYAPNMYIQQVTLIRCSQTSNHHLLAYYCHNYQTYYFCCIVYGRPGSKGQVLRNRGGDSVVNNDYYQLSFAAVQIIMKRRFY